MYKIGALPQRIVLKQKTTLYVVYGSRIGTSSLRKGEIFHPPSMQQPREAKVSFDAARLVIESVFLIALLGELFLDGPWPRPHGRIFDLDLVFERGRAGPRPAFDQMQVLARSLEIGLRTEVRHVDDEGVALPAATRVAIPLADVGRQMRAPVHDDVPLPPLALAHVVEDRDAALCLHDPPVAAGPAAKLGQSAGQAAVRQVAVLRTIMAIDRHRVVAGSPFPEFRRRRRIVLPTAAGRRLVLAGIGRQQQGETKFPLGGGHLLSLRRQRRNPAVGWIDDQRRARAGALEG